MVLDIYSKGESPSKELSNFYPHKFIFDGVKCGSIEGFLQSLKYKNKLVQRFVCRFSGKRAKKLGGLKRSWKKSGVVVWQGRRILRTGAEFSALISRMYHAVYSQCADFKRALAQTAGCTLAHTIGSHDASQTILTEEEFLFQLNALRAENNIE